ncbi:MAG TPA: amino acid permease [Actinomycetota bacterium]|nr:amino acid permease [Actinomycetota bacterium]
MSRLTVSQGAAVSIGAVLGTGVISLPALGAQVAGPASLLAWIALIVLSIPLATTFAALGARYPDAGGVSTYVRRAFGGRAAAIVGWCFYFAVPVGAPAAGFMAGAYVSAAVGGGLRTTLLTTGALILVVTAMNAGGVRISGRVQLGLAVLLVTLLLAATLTSLPHADLANLTPFAPHGWAAIAPAAAVLVWGFAGWEAVTSLAADFRRPARDVPRATAIAIVVVSVLYLAVAAASLLVLGPATATTEAPLAELLAIGVGGEVRVLTAVAALLLTLGAMNAYFAGSAKLGAALARDGALPAWLARGSSAGEVPRRSLAVIATLSAASLVAAGAFGVSTRSIVLLTTGSFVLVYVLGTAAAVKLLPRRSWSRRSAVVALASALALLVMAGPYLLWPLGLAAVALVYLAGRSWRSRRRPEPVLAAPFPIVEPGVCPRR